MQSRPGFWVTADHEAAKVFGRRFWRVLIAFRIARAVRVPVLLVVGGGLAFWLVRFPGVPEFRIPVWAWVAAGISGTVVLAFRLHGFRIWLLSLRYRIFS